MLLMDDIRRGNSPTFPSAVRPQVAMQPRSIWDAIRSRIDRVRAGVAGAARRAGENLMPVPEGMEGLLSPEQISAARRRGLLAMGGAMLESSGAPSGGGMTPTFGQSLGRGLQAAQGAYDQGIAGTLQMAEAATGMKEKRRIDSFRADLAKRYPITADMPPEEMNKALMSMYAEAVRAGDMEMASKTAQVASALANQTQPTPEGLMAVPGDVIDPATGKSSTVIIGGRSGRTVRSFETAPKQADPAQLARDRQAAQKDRRDFENNLASEYLKTVTPLRNSALRIDTSLQQTGRALAGDGTARVSLLYAFLNGLDGSVVRESDLAMMARAAGWGEAAQNQIDYVLSGGKKGKIMPDTVLRSIIQSMGTMRDLIDAEADLQQEQFETRATSAGSGDLKALFPTMRDRSNAKRGGGEAGSNTQPPPVRR